jgi:hypothetical protein
MNDKPLPRPSRYLDLPGVRLDDLVAAGREAVTAEMKERLGSDQVTPSFYKHAWLSRGRPHPPHDDDMIAARILRLYLARGGVL